MARITGNTNDCQIMTNEQFISSGISETDLSTIYITNKNGLDVSKCFGIETNIITVNEDNVILSADCDTSLEIKITEGVINPVVCDYVDFVQDQDSGLVIFEYPNNKTSLNTHPDCCESIGFQSEMGPDHYYVCRWRAEIDPTDCKNYTITGQFNTDEYMIFDYAGGGTTTNVPNVECCYGYGLVEVVNGNEINCIKEDDSSCGELELLGTSPRGGKIYVTFYRPSTNTVVDKVSTTECCASLGYLSEPNGDGFYCYNEINGDAPMITINGGDCCSLEGDGCTKWKVRVGPSIGVGEKIKVSYIDCANKLINAKFSEPDTVTVICASKVKSIDVGYGPVNGTPYIPITDGTDLPTKYMGTNGSVFSEGAGATCGVCQYTFGLDITIGNGKTIQNISVKYGKINTAPNEWASIVLPILLNDVGSVIITDVTIPPIEELGVYGINIIITDSSGNSTTETKKFNVSKNCNHRSLRVEQFGYKELPCGNDAVIWWAGGSTYYTSEFGSTLYDDPIYSYMGVYGGGQHEWERILLENGEMSNNSTREFWACGPND